MKKEEQKKEEKKKGTSAGYKIYSFLFFVVFFIVPFSIANFVDGGDEFLKSIGPVVVSLCLALIINWFLGSKHITALENEDADSYVKKGNIDITYRYDEYTHTS